MHVWEDFEREAARREKSEDVLDHCELIPFDQHEQYPGMEKHLDLPETPRDRYIYLGNCKQPFYDEFPEGHPDTSTINQVLYWLDKDWDEIDETYGTWVKSRILVLKMRPYCKRYLTTLVDILVSGRQDPNDAKAMALKGIDRAWAKEHQNTLANRLADDPIWMMLQKKDRIWTQEAEEGKSNFGKVKQFGSLLWAKFRNQMMSHHWTYYRQLKKRFAPAIIHEGTDLNRCSLQELQEKIHLSRQHASRIWCDRPFESLAELLTKGYLDKGIFARGEGSSQVIDTIEVFASKATEKKDPKIMSRLSEILVKAQRDQYKGLTPDDWRLIWSYYRILREELNVTIQKDREKTHE
jgi:hypothetical protein